MHEAAVTSKGQVTIPAAIRRALGLREHDRLTFTPMPDGTVVLRAKTRSLRELRGLLPAPPGEPRPVEQLGLGQG
ncbi:transcriptional regulator, AbrB family [Tepidimonas sediminis]|uniref:Transcriptional regulator, AbrB family n=1 Tax=Tepidimonas sediminis TaxID=2588941 RepID=A0A554WSY3_9BURK|nr:type II toxin-antitoxin system PrlF family antitoxin [Tepidimonas sediminis]TSE26685.1 transcriptional regulator, AbrB family [Tepidimonas sediminis]